MDTESESQQTAEPFKRKKAFPWRTLFLNKAFDLLIVIVGVSIAIQVETFKQDGDRNEQERFYLENLLVDLDNDILECDDNLKELRWDMQLAVRCVGKIQRGESIADSLGLVVQNVSSTKTFEGHRNTYTTILNSNGLSVIKDTGIRTLLADYYRSYISLDRFDERYSEFVSSMQGYFSQSIDYNNARRIVDPGVLERIQTKNLLTLAAVQVQYGIWRYEPTVQKAKALKERIKQTLSR